LLGPGSAAPTVNIATPASGSVFTGTSVNVTGTASGSDAQWQQTDKEHFVSGTLENLDANADGTLTLNRSRMTVYDNFDDNSLDSNLWFSSESNGITVTEENSELRFSGTAYGYNMSGSAEVDSSLSIPNSVSVDLKSVTGTGYGYVGGMYLYQNYQNKVYFMFDCWDPQSNQPYLYWGYQSNGNQYDTSLGNLPAGTQNFKISYDNGTARLFLNGALKGTVSLHLNDPFLMLRAECYYSGDTLDMRWDNVKWGDFHSLSGNFTSSVFDSSCTDPVLKKVNWTVETPSGTSATVQLRSSDSEDMGAPNSWTTVTNGQSSALPAVKRYIQYRVTLASADGAETPVFKDITISYSKPVVKVEVSIDEKSTWIPAVGKASWYANLELPENTTTIWVRATDVAGDISLSSVKVDVDTTRPSGSVTINGNAKYTIDPDVVLNLNATDRYGIASMMVSESPDFPDSSWEDFTTSSHWALSAGDGIKTVYAKFKDRNGWESRTCSDSILLDTLPPTGTVTIDMGAEYTRNTTVTLAIAASDPIGVQAMLVSNSADFKGALWTEFQESLAWSLLPGDGERTVFVKLRDNGMHVSPAISGSIKLDSTAPSVSVVINDGAAATRFRDASVELLPTENYAVVSMQLREGDGAFSPLADWIPFERNVSFRLSAGDGMKTISARLMDAAGNIGSAGSGRIMLDLTAPLTALGSLPATSPRAAITVTWSAKDPASGVLWYDVQYKAGDGAWTDWLVHTSLTSSVFTGEDLTTYSFRARAQDKASNLEEYPAMVDNAVTVQLPMPVMTISSLSGKSTLSGKAVIAGTCEPVSEGRNVTRVEWRVDNGIWQTADGKLIWSFKLDTTKLFDGKHLLKVRTFDGKNYSDETAAAFSVKNASAKGFIGANGALLLAVAIGVLAFLYRKR
jgi:hypothetical protein